MYKFCDAIILGVLFSSCVQAEDAQFSTSTQELHIPRVNTDDGKSYDVTMKLIYDHEILLFKAETKLSLTLEERFANVQKGMTRPGLIRLLGIPDSVLNLTKSKFEYCDEPALATGSAFERWEYGVDHTKNGNTGGYVVWFAAVKDTEWQVVGKNPGISCM